jgi:hypothetical protein
VRLNVQYLVKQLRETSKTRKRGTQKPSATACAPTSCKGCSPTLSPWYDGEAMSTRSQASKGASLDTATLAKASLIMSKTELSARIDEIAQRVAEQSTHPFDGVRGVIEYGLTLEYPLDWLARMLEQFGPVTTAQYINADQHIRQMSPMIVQFAEIMSEKIAQAMRDLAPHVDAAYRQLVDAGVIEEKAGEE